MQYKSKRAQRKELSRKLAAYGAAAGAALAVAGPAQADVVYSAQDVTAVKHGELLDLDLDSDGKSDLRAGFGEFPGIVASGADLPGAVIGISPYGGTGPSDTNLFGLGLSTGASIGADVSSARWNSVSVVLFPTYSAFFGLSGDGGYLGVRFHVDGDMSNWYYGWIHLDKMAATDYHIDGWAYESDAGVAIAAGDTGTSGGGDPVPEPSSLALLAMGAAGLAAYRRKRDAA